MIFEQELSEALISELEWMHFGRNPMRIPKSIPGTNISFYEQINFRFEKWLRDNPQLIMQLSDGLWGGGIVGKTRSGIWVFFQNKGNKAVVRKAAPAEIQTLPNLPLAWEENISVDSAMEKPN